MKTTVTLSFMWIPSDFWGHSSGPWEGMRLQIRWQKYVKKIHVYDRLSVLLPIVGNKEQSELFADEPLSTEREREIDEFLAQKKLEQESKA